MNNEYTFAVSRIRSLEQKLLTKQQISRLINCRDVFSVFEILNSYGWQIPETHFDYGNYLSEKLNNTYLELVGMLPDCNELKLIIVRNDFQNLKTALKLLVSADEKSNLFVYPTNLNTKLLKNILTERIFYELPEYLSDVASEGYNLVTSTVDGQLLDTFIDVKSLEYLNKKASELNNEMLIKYFTLLSDFTDIKTAYRCSITGKDYNFTLNALCGSDNLSKNDLAYASVKGTDNLLSYLKSTEYGDFADILKASPLMFEKQCDNALLSVFDNSVYDAFGVSPVLKYYFSVENEIKAIRIIITEKRIEADEKEIYERMRNPYV